VLLVNLCAALNFDKDKYKKGFSIFSSSSATTNSVTKTPSAPLTPPNFDEVFNPDNPSKSINTKGYAITNVNSTPKIHYLAEEVDPIAHPLHPVDDPIAADCGATSHILFTALSGLAEICRDSSAARTSRTLAG